MVCLSSVSRLRLCYLLFATYIVLDVSVSLTTVIELTTGDFGSQTNTSDPDENLKKTNKTLPFEDWASPNEKFLYESTNITERGDILKKAVRKSTKNESDIEQNREGWKGRVTYVKKVSHLNVPNSMVLMDLFIELSGFLVFLTLNITALVGLRKSKALLLLPWLIVYLISIAASYINFAFLLVTSAFGDGFKSWKIFWPLATAISFHLGWILVKTVLEDFKNQTSGSVQNARTQEAENATSNM